MKRIAVARNERGQLTIEAILIMCIFTSIALYVSRYAKSEQLVAKVVEGPWLPIRGMIENGVWEAGAKGMHDHPSMKHRHSSNFGEPNPTN